MKRIGNLYNNLLKFENINLAFNEVCRNTKNKRNVNKFREYKCINIFKAYSSLKNKSYVPGPHYVFYVYEPKKRRVVSQNMFDKMINHLIARQILMPAILPCLIDANVASRIDLGTNAGYRYQDDFLLFHEKKEYLKDSLEKIRKYLQTEKLELNKKTRIYKSESNFIFLGRDKYGKYAKYRLIKRKLKKRFYLYKKGEINLYSLSSSIYNFKRLGCSKM